MASQPPETLDCQGIFNTSANSVLPGALFWHINLSQTARSTHKKICVNNGLMTMERGNQLLCAWAQHSQFKVYALPGSQACIPFSAVLFRRSHLVI